jgi:hypothetical protein
MNLIKKHPVFSYASILIDNINCPVCNKDIFHACTLVQNHSTKLLHNSFTQSANITKKMKAIIRLSTPAKTSDRKTNTSYCVAWCELCLPSTEAPCLAFHMLVIRATYRFGTRCGGSSEYRTGSLSTVTWERGVKYLRLRRPCTLSVAQSSKRAKSKEIKENYLSETEPLTHWLTQFGMSSRTILRLLTRI